MPYEQYLADASTLPYLDNTFEYSGVLSDVTSGTDGYRSSGITVTAIGNLYGYQSELYAGELVIGSGGGFHSYAATGITEHSSTYGDKTYSVFGKVVDAYEIRDSDGSGNSGSQNYVSSTTYSATGSWKSEFSNFTTGGFITTSTAFSTELNGGGNDESESSLFTWEPNNLRSYYFAKTTTVTNLSALINKTTIGNATYTGPLEGSQTAYTYPSLIYPGVPNTFQNIKTLKDYYKFFWEVEEDSKTFNIEWIGYSGGGAQNIGLVYTEIGQGKDISEYASVLMEKDSFFSSKGKLRFDYSNSFSDEGAGIPYTLTYDIITTSEVQSQKTRIQRQTISSINSFLYGFINTNITNTTIYTAGKASISTELTSYSAGFVTTVGTEYVRSGLSYTQVQAISTTSNFTQFVEISGLNKAESFIVRSFVTTTASYTFRGNAYQRTANLDGTPNGYSFSFVPAFVESYLVIRAPPSSNPDTFYTEKAIFGSFAEPSYSIAYNNYSPANCSLVFLALVPLNTQEENGSGYPSWISVYDGTFSGIDRASASNESVTVSQSSSYVGTGATNVYQTISYFIGNNPDSQTTRTTSVAMALASSANSVSRLARTKAENLDSVDMNVYLPSIPIEGANVFFTQGLQGDADYNIDKLLINAYTTAKSTFAGSAVSSFPVSVSQLPYPIRRNKIRIDIAYNEADNNTYNVGLLRYATFL